MWSKRKLSIDTECQAVFVWLDMDHDNQFFIRYVVDVDLLVFRIYLHALIFLKYTYLDACEYGIYINVHCSNLCNNTGNPHWIVLLFRTTDRNIQSNLHFGGIAQIKAVVICNFMQMACKIPNIIVSCLIV